MVGHERCEEGNYIFKKIMLRFLTNLLFASGFRRIAFIEDKPKREDLDQMCNYIYWCDWMQAKILDFSGLDERGCLEGTAQ